jgi:hypothetical protein
MMDVVEGLTEILHSTGGERRGEAASVGSLSASQGRLEEAPCAM